VLNGKRQLAHQYKETSAPVAGIPTIKVLLVEGFLRDMIIDQLDIKTAYLYGDIDTEIYMTQPKGLRRKVGALGTKPEC
jgi:hypothetical protein